MYAVTENAYEDLQRIRRELIYWKKIFSLQNDLITRLIAGECTAKIMGEIADVRQDIADL
jgi:Mg2+ and Co2+ transporter CorA